MRDVLVRLATEPDPTELQRLLPDAWLRENPQHRWNIDDVRRNERDNKT